MAVHRGALAPEPDAHPGAAGEEAPSTQAAEPVAALPLPAPSAAPIAAASAGGAQHLPTSAPVIPVELDLAQLTPALHAAGIELAQTDPAKLAAVQERIAREARPQRVGRERPARAPLEETPLIQVQTRN